MSLFYPFYAEKTFDKTKPLLMYGFGMFGVNYLKGLIAEGVKVVAIFDANPKYHGLSIGNIPVLSPEKIVDFDKNYNVFISTIGYKYTLGKMFKNLGFNNLYFEYVNEFKVTEHCIANKEKFNETCRNNENQISNARKLFCEDRSLATFDAYFDAHRFGKFEDYEKCMTRVDWKRDGIFNFKYDESEVYYDCGAYDGSTATAFHWMTYNKEKWIYAFEPDELNCYAINRKFEFEHLDKCSAHQYAICDIDGSIFFDTPESATAADGMKILEDGKGGVKVPAITLDTFAKTHLPPTMIHMDIEGAEVAALRGATNIIKTHLPQMDISVYHKKSDIWEIPLLIESIAPGKYDFYLRLLRSYYDLQLQVTPKK